MIKTREYSVDIIVLIRHESKFSWYLCEKEYWIMDYENWEYKFSSKFKFKKVETRDPIRAGIEILNTQNWPAFKERITHWEVSNHELSELINEKLPINSWDEKGELFPSLFIDFDNKTLFSVFPEPTRFERYVPVNWIGKFEDFYLLIPAEEKYWVINGVDYFPEH